MTDSTYIKTLEGWLYLAVVIDLFSRRVVGRSMQSRMTTDLAFTSPADGRLAAQAKVPRDDPFRPRLSIHQPRVANSGLEVGRSDRDLGLGTRFLYLRDRLSEEKILASLPAEHGCQDIRLINIDGKVKGAALVFKAAHPAFQRTKPMLHPAPAKLALPGVTIKGSDLKIVGKSDAILEALDTAYRIASVNTPTLFEGQTGVGKELSPALCIRRLRRETAARSPPSIVRR